MINTLANVARTIGIFLFGCMMFSCEKYNPSPDQNQQSTTVDGQKGGSVSWKTIDIDVPAGSFPGKATLVLTEEKAGDHMGTSEGSVFYTISGIPAGFSTSIKISLTPLEGADEGLYATFGHPAFIPSMNSTAIHFQFGSGSMKDGKYVLSLNPLPYSGYPGGEELEVTVGLLKDYGITVSEYSDGSPVKPSGKVKAGSAVATTGGHFEIYAPTSLSSAARSLGNYLEEAYNLIGPGALGFDYSKRTRWPIRVSIRKMDSGTYGYYTPSKWGDNYASMEFNSAKVSDLSELRITAGHEFFHLAQALCDTRNFFSKAISPSPFYWLEEAASVWAEEGFTNVSDYASPVRQGNQWAPFSGVEPGSATDPQTHGYGMSALVKYIVETQGAENIVKIFERQAAGTSNPLLAINEVLSTKLMAFYPDFIDEYIRGKVYTDMSVNYLIGKPDGEFNVIAATDTVKAFESKFPGLSAKAYKIKVSYEGFSNQSSMVISTMNGAKKLIYKIQGSAMTLLGTAWGEFVINDVKKLQTDKSILFVVPVHHLYTEMDEKLEVKIMNSPVIQFTKGSFYIDIQKAVLYKSPENMLISDQNVFWSVHEFIGEYKDGVFEATWDYRFLSSDRKGTIRLVIDQKNRRIISGEIEATNKAVYRPDRDYSTISMKLGPMTTADWNSGGTKFEFLAAEVCNTNNLNSLIYERHWYDSMDKTQNSSILSSYTCDINSYLTIWLSQ